MITGQSGVRASWVTSLREVTGTRLRCSAHTGWFHTREDTLDKVQATLLRPVYEAHRRLIERGLA